VPGAFKKMLEWLLNHTIRGGFTRTSIRSSAAD
jgi:hypothetical protein